MKALFTLLLLATLAQSYAQTKVECTGTPVDQNEQVSVEKIMLDFPQSELHITHRDMRLEVIGLFGPDSGAPMHWWEEDADYFEYVVGEESISFEWGREHFGQLHLDAATKTLKGTITVSHDLAFDVTCRSR